MSTHRLFSALRSMTDDSNIARNNIVAGGSIATILLEARERFSTYNMDELTKRQYLEIFRSVKFNDIDIYRHIEEWTNYDDVALNRIKMPLRTGETLEHNYEENSYYGHMMIQPVQKTEYYKKYWHKIIDVTEKYGVQYIDTLYGYHLDEVSPEGHFLDEVVNHFDLNCCQAGISKDRMYIHPNFTDFLKWKNIMMVNPFTPFHSFARGAKKAHEMSGITFDQKLHQTIVELIYLSNAHLYGRNSHLKRQRHIAWVFGRRYKKMFEQHVNMPKHWEVIPVEMTIVEDHTYWKVSQRDLGLYTIRIDDIDCSDSKWNKYGVSQDKLNQLSTMMDWYPQSIMTEIIEIIKRNFKDPESEYNKVTQPPEDEIPF